MKKILFIIFLFVSACDDDCEGDPCGYNAGLGKYMDCCSGYVCKGSTDYQYGQCVKK